MLIRFAYLAILWIFVLGAISVIRSDMFGARVDTAPARAAASRRPPQQAAVAQARASPRAAPRARSSSSTAPAPATACRSTTAPILIGRGSDAAIRLDDDYVSTRHARIGASERHLVRRGPRLHQRHLHRLPAAHPGDRHPARHAGPRRQDDPRAEEVADGRHAPRHAPGTGAGPAAALRRGLRRRPAPQGEPGLRLRQRAPARRSPTASAARRTATWRAPPRCTCCGGSTSAARPSEMLPALAGVGAPDPRPARRDGRGRRRARRHQHHRHRGALRRRTGSASRTSATAGPTCCATAQVRAAHQGPHVRPDARRRGPDHRGGVPGPPAPQHHPAGRRRRARHRARPLPRRRCSPATGCCSAATAAPARVDDAADRPRCSATARVDSAARRRWCRPRSTAAPPTTSPSSSPRWSPAGAVDDPRDLRRGDDRSDARRRRRRPAPPRRDAGPCPVPPAGSSDTGELDPVAAEPGRPRGAALRPPCRRADGPACAGSCSCSSRCSLLVGGRSAGGLRLDPAPVLRRRRRPPGRDLPGRPDGPARRRPVQSLRGRRPQGRRPPAVQPGAGRGRHRRRRPRRRPADRRPSSSRRPTPRRRPRRTPRRPPSARSRPRPRPDDRPVAADAGDGPERSRKPSPTRTATPTPTPPQRQDGAGDPCAEGAS